MEEIKNYMLEYGYSEKDIEKILSIDELHHFHWKTLINLLSTLGYKKNNIIKIIISSPICDVIKMEEIKKYMLEYGYNEKDIEKILNTYPLYTSKCETLLNNIKDITNLLSILGYTKKNIIKMTKLYPTLFSYNIYNVKKKIDDIITLGYTESEVIKMAKCSPSLLGYSIDKIKQKINDLVSLGYTKLDVINMTKFAPSLFTRGINNVKKKFDNLVDLEYTKEDIIKMTKLFPALLTLNINNIKQKFDFYKLIDIDNQLIDNAKLLMQSVELSYARYRFYESKSIEINAENYRKLFIGQKQFEKTYGISKKELLEMYDYNEFIKEKNNDRTI